MIPSLLEKVAKTLLSHFDAPEFIRHREDKNKDSKEPDRRRSPSHSRHRKMSTPNPPSRNDHVHYKPQRRGTDNSSPSKNSGVDFKISVLGLKVNVQKDDDKDKLQSRPKSMETPRAKPVHVRQDSPQESRGRRASSDARSGNWLSRSLSRSKSRGPVTKKPVLTFGKRKTTSYAKRTEAGE
jgi:hypothetical protein